MRGGPQLSPSGGCGETAPACAGRSRSRPWRPGRWRPRPPGRCRTAPAARRWSRPSAAGAATASWPAGPPPALRAPPRRLPSAAPPFPRSAWCPSFSYHSAPADSRQAAFCSRCSDSIMAGGATASTAGAAETTAQCSATFPPLCMVPELQLSQCACRFTPGSLLQQVQRQHHGRRGHRQHCGRRRDDCPVQRHLSPALHGARASAITVRLQIHARQPSAAGAATASWPAWPPLALRAPPR